MEVAKADTTNQFSLFHHSDLTVPAPFGASGSAVGNVHNSCFVVLLPWLGLLGLSAGSVVEHMRTLGTVTWAGADAEVRSISARRVPEVRARSARLSGVHVKMEVVGKCERGFE